MSSLAPVCESCRTRCSFCRRAEFARLFLFAWALGKDIPVCSEYEERNWHGHEGVRA